MRHHHHQYLHHHLSGRRSAAPFSPSIDQTQRRSPNTTPSHHATTQQYARTRGYRHATSRFPHPRQQVNAQLPSPITHRYLAGPPPPPTPEAASTIRGSPNFWFLSSLSIKVQRAAWRQYYLSPYTQEPPPLPPQLWQRHTTPRSRPPSILVPGRPFKRPGSPAAS